MYNSKVSFRTVLKYRKNISTSIPKQKSFDDIPGPKSYPVFGSRPTYLPLIGDYREDTLPANALKKYKQYGPIVREQIYPGVNFVFLFKPDDIKYLYHTEGRYPERNSHQAIQHYRLNKENVYNNGGILPTNGEAWGKLRSVFQKGFSSPNSVRNFLPILDEVVNEWLEYIVQVKSTEDCLKPISRLFLEIMGRSLMDTKFNAFSKDEFWSGSRSSKLIQATETINFCLMKTDVGPIGWKKFQTGIYKQFEKSHMFIEEVALDILSLKMSQVKESSQPETLLESYLSSSKVDFKDITGMVCDLFIGGIDTATYTTCFLLYHLAKYPHVQDILYKEALELIPQPNSPVTVDVLERANYTSAVLKETLRLRPIAIGILRVLTQDTIFSGYEVPKGTTVLTGNEVACRLEEYFRDPSEFKPERWLKTHPLFVKPYPFSALPFGIGPRSCIARYFAEQNMKVLMLKLIRNYEIRWKGGVLDTIPNLINKPNGPINLKITKRAL